MTTNAADLRSMKNTRRHDLVTFPRSATDLIQTLNSKPSGGFYPRTRFASTFTEGEALKHPPGDISLMFASRPSPRARTGNYGDNRIRTGDPLLAKQVLYQLSYVPRKPTTLVGQGGLEPPTPRLSSVCSNQLSY
jgi:hypothetical protein